MPRTRKTKPRPPAPTPSEYDAADAERGMNWDAPRHLPAGGIMSFPSMGPLCGITHRRKLVFAAGKKTRSFTVVIHGLYNARGLYGSECNGVAVLDEDKRQVLLANHARQGSGYYGPTQAQIDEWKRVCGLSYDQFRAFANAHPQARYEV